jgi:hypothetical protein
MHLSFWWAKMISEINSERKDRKKKSNTGAKQN